MCKIIAVLNNKPENTDTINDLLKANVTQLASQKDGYSVFNGETTQFYLGDNHYRDEAVASHLAYTGQPFFMAHFRLATSGDRDIEGLHMHPLDDRYIFAHNGTVSGFKTVKKFNDSHYFAKRLIAQKVIDEKTVLKTMNKYGFWGKGFLWDNEDKALHIFCNTKMYIYALDNCLIFATYELTRKTERWEVEEVLGYPFTTEKETIKIPVKHKREIDDTYLYFKDNSFQFSASIKREYAGSVYSGNGKSTYKPYSQYYHENKSNIRQELKEGIIYDIKGNPLPFNPENVTGGVWDDTGDTDIGDTKENSLVVVE